MTNTIKPVLLEILKAYHTYLGNEVWEETIVKANNGDCIWIAGLCDYVLRKKFDLTVQVMCSPHHTFLVHEGKVYDTLYPNGSHVLSLPFYGVESKYRSDVSPSEGFFLNPWDEDIFVVVCHICDLYGIPRLEITGAEFETPEPIIITASQEEIDRLENMNADIEYQVKPGFDSDHVHVTNVTDRNLGN